MSAKTPAEHTATMLAHVAADVRQHALALAERTDPGALDELRRQHAVLLRWTGVAVRAADEERQLVLRPPG